MEETSLQPASDVTDVPNAVLAPQLQECAQNIDMQTHRIDVITQDFRQMKTSIGKLESKLGPLQKMVASQTDKGLEMRKELTELDKTAKRVMTETTSKLQEVVMDVRELKRKQQELEQTVLHLRQTQNAMGASSSGSSSMSGAGDTTSPQILDAIERQLGLYDVRIAEMDMRFQVLERTSYNGILVWKITDYSRRKREAVSGRNLSLYSQPFYTSRYGYKMCTRVYLNGDGMGKGTHMSLFFVVMKGEYDAMLPWPFRQKVTLMLLDQSPDRRHLSDTFRPDPTSSSFKLPTSDMNIASGCPLFVAHSVIDNSSYVRDDTIFIKIQVDTSDLENI